MNIGVRVLARNTPGEYEVVLFLHGINDPALVLSAYEFDQVAAEVKRQKAEFRSPKARPTRRKAKS